MNPTAKTLRAALEDVAGATLDADAARALEAFVERATSGHPDLDVPAERWAAQVWTALRADVPEAWASRLERLIAPDVLLAAGLCVGHVRAVELFEQRFVPSIRATLASLRLRGEELEEMLQRTRVHILVASEAGPPRVSQYGGKGSLEGWVRTTALRLAMRDLARREPEASSGILERLGVSEHTEPGEFRARRHQQLRAAVADAFAELPPRERRLLRARYVENRTAVELAGEHDVHESTMSRWLARARDKLSRRIRARARALMAPSDINADRLIDTLAADVEASLGGLFDTRATGG